MLETLKAMQPGICYIIIGLTVALLAAYGGILYFLEKGDYDSRLEMLRCLQNRYVSDISHDPSFWNTLNLGTSYNRWLVAVSVGSILTVFDLYVAAWVLLACVGVLEMAWYGIYKMYPWHKLDEKVQEVLSWDQHCL